MADALVPEEIVRDGVAVGQLVDGDVEVERQVQRLEEVAGLVEADPVVALQLLELGSRLDDVVVAHLHPEHAHAVVPDDLPGRVERRRAVPVVLERLELEPDATLPLHELVRAGADHVRVHELVGLAGDDAAVALHRVLAHDRRGRRVHDGSEEQRRRLDEGDLEGEVVDDPHVRDRLGQLERLALGRSIVIARSHENRTSSAVSSVPSWKTTPSRIGNV